MAIPVQQGMSSAHRFVQYGGIRDVAPQTTLGRIVAGITMIIGIIAIFGSLTAVITSLVLEPAKETTDPVLAKLEKIEAELAKLRSRLVES